uniref:Uncharacterized protein n=1 Tax=Scleropages formosus TaxID=113540 RepID=A0A8C9VUA5_SCLFO
NIIYTLRAFEELKESRFGRPAPRHGLKLLFWFAKDAVDFDDRGNMVLLCDPREGHFGFHHFGNFEKILPELQKPGEEKYFEVGNLKPDTYPGSRDLPDYVRGDYDGTWRNGEHNKDRVIVRLKGRNVVREVYITEHSGWSKEFHKKSTYALNPSLIQMIKCQRFVQLRQRELEPPSYKLEIPGVNPSSCCRTLDEVTFPELIQ